MAFLSSFYYNDTEKDTKQETHYQKRGESGSNIVPNQGTLPNRVSSNELAPARGALMNDFIRLAATPWVGSLVQVQRGRSIHPRTDEREVERDFPHGEEKVRSQKSFSGT